MKNYNVYKKRDGQDYKLVGEIYASNFDAAKKKFASNMTDCNHSLSNDIIQLSKEEDGVDVSGWYDLSGSVLVDMENPHDKDDTITDYKNSEMELVCSNYDINEGFDYWSEDVYTWELRKD